MAPVDSAHRDAGVRRRVDTLADHMRSRSPSPAHEHNEKGSSGDSGVYRLARDDNNGGNGGGNSNHDDNHHNDNNDDNIHDDSDGNGNNNDNKKSNADSNNNHVHATTTVSVFVIAPPPSTTTSSKAQVAAPAPTLTALSVAAVPTAAAAPNEASAIVAAPAVVSSAAAASPPVAGAPTGTPTLVFTMSATPSTLSHLTYARTEKNPIETDFIPRVTTSVVIGQAATSRSLTYSSGLPRPTSAGDADGTHKGTGTSSDANNSDINNSNNAQSSGTKINHKLKHQKHLLSPTAERALISVGSIGAFVTVCMLVWLVWRTCFKRKQKKGDSKPKSKPLAAISRLSGRAYGKIAGKVPFLDQKQKAWQSLEDGPMAEVKTAAIAPTPRPPMTMAPSSLEPIVPFRAEAPGTVDAGDGFPNMASNASPQPTMAPLAYYPTGLSVPPPLAQPSSPPQPASNLYQSSLSPANTNPQEQRQSMLDDASAISGTLRSHMPDAFYNQSELARMPSDAYDPARRAVNRISELSSLSSGFGDGEMLVLLPPNPKAGSNAPSPITRALPYSIPIPAEPMSSKGRFSWMRDNKRMTRDTLYSVASEDQPARFRTVDSWVKQQTGRVRRGQASIDATSDASAGKTMPGNQPGVPHLPEEQRLTMMMDDEQVPRRPDTVLMKSVLP